MRDLGKIAYCRLDLRRRRIEEISPFCAIGGPDAPPHKSPFDLLLTLLTLRLAPADEASEYTRELSSVMERFWLN